MLFIIYKTTNLINNKYYIGKHKQSSLEFDGYLGSGSALKKAVKKYGSENFKRETLKVFNTEEESYQYEALLVEKHLSNSMCYNLAPGGSGCNIKNHSNDTKQKMSISAKKRWENETHLFQERANRYKGPDGEEQLKKMSERTSSLWQDPDYVKSQMKSRSTSQYKKKLSDAAKKDRVSCIHCGMSSRASIISRWHGDNCKHKH